MIRNQEMMPAARFRWAVSLVVLGLMVGATSVAHAQAPAPPADSDARFGAPGEQDQPGAALLGAGRAAAVQGRWEAALDHFRSLTQEYPAGELADDATYWTAQSLLELGRYQEAVSVVNDFLDRFPRSNLRGDARIVRFQAAEALVQRGNADYERYLRDEAAPTAPTPTATPTARPPRPPRAPQATEPVDAPEPPQAAEPVDDLRVMALDALIGMDPEAAWPVLERIIAEPGNPELRGRAVWLLSQMGTDESFDLLLDLARTDPDPEVRGNALFWISQSDEHADQAIDLLIDVVESDSDPEFVGQALFGLSQSDSPRALDALNGVVRDTSKSDEIRSQALFHLSQQHGSVELLRDILLQDPSEEMQGQALFGLSQINTEEASQILLEYARSDAPAEMRSNAIFWLGQRNGDGAIDVLIELWDEVDDVEIRNQLLFALAQTNSERAIDHLVAVATDEEADAELRQQAIFWLGQSNNDRAKAALLRIIGGGDER